MQIDGAWPDAEKRAIWADGIGDRVMAVLIRNAQCAMRNCLAARVANCLSTHFLHMREGDKGVACDAQPLSGMRFVIRGHRSWLGCVLSVGQDAELGGIT